MVDRDVSTILVVDDEVDMRLLVRSVMSLAGDRYVIVAEAADGTEAILQWRALGGPPVPDIIILDNRMPGRSGLEVAEEIIRERPEQRIVLFSAFLDDRVRARARELGIRACLTKEDVAELPELIASIKP